MSSKFNEKRLNILEKKKLVNIEINLLKNKLNNMKEKIEQYEKMKNIDIINIKRLSVLTSDFYCASTVCNHDKECNRYYCIYIHPNGKTNTDSFGSYYK